MRILLIEDDSSLADALRKALQQQNYAVDLAADGLSASHFLAVESFDLVILDLGLPKLDGEEVLRRLRDAGNLTPVIILTARKSLGNKITGLDLGADDYITKPFSLEELLARVRAILRRGVNQTAPTLTHGRLVFDTVSRTVRIDDKEAKLRARELGLLEALLRSTGRVITKQQLAEHLYGLDEPIGDNAIEVYISRLRKKLPSHSFSLRTIRGIGYVLESPE